MATWQEKFAQEIQAAYEARARNNEAQARVRARRAAGIAVREYLARRGIQPLSSSAYDLLKSLLEVPDVPARALKCAEYLTLRVDEEFKRPVDADLVQEAQTLCQQLLPGE
jgi:HEPN domain-containing protein